MNSGPGKPPPTEQLAGLFAGAPFRWWLTDGVALELFAERSWRPHDDIDVGICRTDAPALHAWLSSLTLYVAGGGRVRLWSGEPPASERSENNIWVKQRLGAPWLFDIAVGDGDESGWVYRRDPRIRRPWEEVILWTPSGVPFLAPEIQLLFKSKGRRAKDDHDAEVVIPLMDDGRRAWLRERLPADHAWRQLLPPPPLQ